MIVPTGSQLVHQEFICYDKEKRMDTHGCYDSKSGLYTVPVTGNYVIRGQAFKAIPTGEFETVRNPLYKWWTPWREKTITREIYKTVVIREGTELKYFKAGDTVETDLIYRI